MISQPFAILHIEDDPNDVLLVNRAIKKSNALVTIHSVNDGDQALAYLSGAGAFANREQHPLPNLILLDLKMPRKSGFEVLEWIRSNAAHKRKVVIIFTSSRHEQDINRAYELGANSYLVKPVGFEALQETIVQLNCYWGRMNQNPSI